MAADSRWRAVVRVLRSQADALGSAVFPAACSLCATPLARLTRVPVCSSCWLDLPPQSGSLCLHCGEALGAHAFSTADRAPGDWLCRPCRLVPPPFDRAIAHGLYRGTMRSLIHLLKYTGVQPVARPLGALMAAQVAAQPGIPLRMTVVPVPLHAGKQRRRGFNQAELLARALAHSARHHGMALQVETRLLLRSKATESQAALTPSARRRNLQAAFTVPGHTGTTRPLTGRRLLLVDDIYTTGATARAAAGALKRAGAQEVWVATLARAQRAELAEPVHANEIPMEEDVAAWG
jgi:ComF family protein